jgi:hypothetical protein
MSGLVTKCARWSPRTGYISRFSLRSSSAQLRFFGVAYRLMNVSPKSRSDGVPRPAVRTSKGLPPSRIAIRCRSASSRARECDRWVAANRVLPPFPRLLWLEPDDP